VSPSQWALKQKEEYSKGFRAFVSRLGLDTQRNTARQQARQTMMQAQLAMRALQQQWDKQPNSQPFHFKLKELDTKRTQYIGLAALRQQKLHQLEAHRKQSQLQKFLDGYVIWHADISNIGPSRKSTLQSYGIETAADVTQSAVMNVPGFGPTFTNKLLSWRSMLERKFIFNPALAVDATEIAKAEAEIASTRQKLEQELQHGVGQLHRISQQITTQRQALMQQAEKCLRDIAQAQADLSIL